VVLAEVRVDDDGRILFIDNCSCRRVVPSLARVVWRCAAAAGGAAGRLNPDHVDAAQTTRVKIEGGRFQSVPEIRAGPDLAVENVTLAAAAAGGSIEFDVTAAADATIGPRKVLLVDTDCTTYAYDLTVRAGRRVERVEPPIPERRPAPPPPRGGRPGRRRAGGEPPQSQAEDT
jgi:hypothetical protein